MLLYRKSSGTILKSIVRLIWYCPGSSLVFNEFPLFVQQNTSSPVSLLMNYCGFCSTNVEDPKGRSQFDTTTELHCPLPVNGDWHHWKLGDLIQGFKVTSFLKI